YCGCSCCPATAGAVCGGFGLPVCETRAMWLRNSSGVGKRRPQAQSMLFAVFSMIKWHTTSPICHRSLKWTPEYKEEPPCVGGAGARDHREPEAKAAVPGDKDRQHGRREERTPPRHHGFLAEQGRQKGDRE